MYRNQKKSFVKIRAPLATPFSHAKNLGGPLGPKKNCLQIWVYCIQNDRLGHTVSTKQTGNWSEFLGLRYRTKRAEIWRFGLVRIIHVRFVGYLSTANSDQFIVCFIETVWPSRVVPWQRTLAARTKMKIWNGSFPWKSFHEFIERGAAQPQQASLD